MTELQKSLRETRKQIEAYLRGDKSGVDVRIVRVKPDGGDGR
jgi:hypothetical protein